MTVTKLNPEDKAKFVEALRSEKYQQGSGYLLKDGRYCCLGVACEVFYPAGKFIDNNEYQIEGNVFGAYGWGHFRTPNLLDLDSGITKMLAQLNDDGKTFAEIADWIDENL